MSQHAHISVKWLSSTRKLTPPVCCNARMSLSLVAWQGKNLKWYVAAFYNGARHSIKANKHSWLSLDIAPFSRLSHGNASNSEYTTVGVFNVAAVKTSCVNRRPNTICFFMIPDLIVSNLPSPFASFLMATLQRQIWNWGLLLRETHPPHRKSLNVDSFNMLSLVSCIC